MNNSTDTSDQYYRGKLDDFRIYNKALSANEIRSIYGYTLSRQQGHISPYSYYFNGTSGNPEDNAYISRQVTDFPKSFTISFWKKLEDRENPDTSFTFVDETGTTVIAIQLNKNVIFKINDVVQEIAGINDEDWHHWSFTYDNTYGILDIWKDGLNRFQQSVNKKDNVSFSTTSGTVYVGGNHIHDISPGYLEDFRIYKSALTPNEIKQIGNEWTGMITKNDTNLKLWYQFNNNPEIFSKEYPVFDDHENNLIGWYKFDGNVTNTTNENITVTTTGTPEYKTFLNKSSVYFNSSSYYTTSSIDLYEKSFSVSFWAYLDSTGTANKRIGFSKGTSGTNNSVFLDIRNHVSPPVVFWGFWGNNVTFINNGELKLQNWHHLIGTWNNDKQELVLYLDGKLNSSKQNVDKLNSAVDNTGFIIGRNFNDGNNLGYLSDFRIYNKALSQEEIASIVGKPNFIDNVSYGIFNGHETDLVAWYKFDGDLTDSGPNNYDLTTSSSISYTFTKSIRGKSSIYFDGTVKDIKLDGVDLSTIQSANGITISTWAWLDPSAGSYSSILFVRNVTDWLSFRRFETQNRFVVDTLATGQSRIDLYSSSNETHNSKWVHLLFTMDNGTNGNVNIKLYVDGYLESEISNGFVIPSVSPIYIGQGDDHNEPFKGYLDDFRIYKRVLTAQEVKQVKGISPVPINQYDVFDGHEDNLLLWIKGDKDISDSSTYNRQITNANSEVSYTNTAIRGDFDILATGDHAYRFVGDVIPENTTELTIAFWIKDNTTDANSRIFRQEDNILISSYNLSLQMNNVVTASRSSSVSLDEWTHITFTVDIVKGSSSFNVYYNGINVNHLYTIKSNGTDGIETGYQNYDPQIVYTFLHYAWGSPIQFYKGFLNDFRVYNKMLTPDEVRIISGAKSIIQPYYLSLPSNDTSFLTSSQVAKGTQSIYFDGSTNRNIEIKMNMEAIRQINGISICVWVWMDSGTGEYGNIIFSREVESNAKFMLRRNASNSNFAFASASPNANILHTGFGATNKWVHLTVTGDNGIDGSVVYKLYVDGLLNKTFDNGGYLPYRDLYNDRILFGERYDNGEKFKGYLDDFRIYDRVLTSEEVNQIFKFKYQVPDYTTITDSKGSNDLKIFNAVSTSATFDYPGYIDHEKDLVAWYKFDENLRKDEKNQYNLQLGNGSGSNEPDVSNFSIRGINSVEINSGDYFESDFSTYNKSYTLTMWIYRKTNTVAGDLFIQGSSTPSSGNQRGKLHINLGQTNIRYSLTHDTALDYTSTIPHGEWIHLVFSYSHDNTKANRERSIYLNGKNVAFDIGKMSDQHSDIGTTKLKNNIHTGGMYIDDFRIYNKALSVSEVYSIYSSSRVYNYANTSSPYLDGFVKNTIITGSSMQYPGYEGHENDLIEWYKFDEDLNDSSGNN